VLLKIEGEENSVIEEVMEGLVIVKEVVQQEGEVVMKEEKKGRNIVIMSDDDKRVNRVSWTN